MSKEKKYRIGTYLILIPAILFLFPKVYAQHESKTINDSWKFIRENAKLPLQQPMMTVRGTAYISRTHGIRMHIQKKVLPGNRLVSPYTDIAEKLANQTGIPETGCSQ